MKLCTWSFKATNHEHLCMFYGAFWPEKAHLLVHTESFHQITPELTWSVLSDILFCGLRYECALFKAWHLTCWQTNGSACGLAVVGKAYSLWSSMAGSWRRSFGPQQARNVRHGDWGKEEDPRLSKAHRISSLGKPRSIIGAGAGGWRRPGEITNPSIYIIWVIFLALHLWRFNPSSWETARCFVEVIQRGWTIEYLQRGCYSPSKLKWSGDNLTNDVSLKLIQAFAKPLQASRSILKQLRCPAEDLALENGGGDWSLGEIWTEGKSPRMRSAVHLSRWISVKTPTILLFVGSTGNRHCCINILLL